MLFISFFRFLSNGNLFLETRTFIISYRLPILLQAADPKPRRPSKQRESVANKKPKDGQENVPAKDDTIVDKQQENDIVPDPGAQPAEEAEIERLECQILKDGPNQQVLTNYYGALLYLIKQFMLFTGNRMSISFRFDKAPRFLLETEAWRFISLKIIC